MKYYFKIFIFILITISNYKTIAQCSSYTITSNKYGSCQASLYQFVIHNVPTTATIRWNYGTGWINDDDTILPYFTNVGIINVQCEITHISGSICYVKKDSIAEIYDKPIPNFKAGRVKLCNGIDSTSFTDISNSSYIRNWIIDGTNYFNANKTVNHYFTSTGKKSITMVVESNKGCRTIKQFDTVINIIPNINISFSADKQNGCVPLKIKFIPTINTNGNSISSYKWDFPSGLPVIQNKEIPDSVLYNADGNYNVKLSVVANTGCQYNLLLTSFLTFGKKDSLKILISDTLVCKNENINVSDLFKTAKGNFDWQFPNASQVSATNKYIQNINYNNAGKYDIILNYNYNGCIIQKSIPKAIRVIGIKSNFGASDHYHCIVPHTVHLSNYSTTSESGLPSYEWQYFQYNSLFSQSTKNNDSIKLNQMGTYDVKLITHHKGCSDTLMVKNFINLRKLKPNFIASPYIACQNQDIQFSANYMRNSYLAPDSFYWTFYDRNEIDILGKKSGNSPKFKYADTGFYTVKIVSDNKLGCKDSSIIKDTIRIISHNISFELKDTLICNGSVVTGTALSTPKIANFIYTWNFKNTNSGNVYSYQTPNLNSNFNEAGLYEVDFSHQILNGCFDTIKKKYNLKVNGVKSEIQLDTISGCSPFMLKATSKIIEDFHFNFPNKKYKYKWSVYPNTGIIIENDTNFETKIHFKDNGEFYVYLTVENSAGCKDYQMSKKVSIGVNAYFSLSDYKICANSKTIIYNQSQLKPTSYKWFFPNDISILSNNNDQVLEISSNKSDTFRIGLIASKYNQCFDTFYTNLEIIRVKVDFISPDTALRCAPSFAQFYAKTSNTDELYWDFGDGNTLTTYDNFAAHIYKKNSGFKNGFNIKLIGKNAEGCYDSIFKANFIKILGPRPEFGIENKKGCEPALIKFKKFGGDIFKFWFDFGDGSPIDSMYNLSHLYTTNSSLADSQIYTPKIIAIDSLGCKVFFAPDDIITIYKSPIGNQVILDTILCPNQYLDFTISGLNYNKSEHYLINVDTLKINVGHIPKSIGKYQLKTILSNQYQCFDTFINPLEVVNNPIPDFEILGKNCPDEILFLKQKSKVPLGLKSNIWTLTEPNNNITVLQDSSFKLSSIGINQIKLNITDNNNCINQIGKSIELYDTALIPQGNINYISHIDNQNLKIVAQKSNFQRFYNSYLTYNQNIIFSQYQDQNIDFIYNNLIEDSLHCISYLIEDSCLNYNHKIEKHCAILLKVQSTKPFINELSWTPYLGWNNIDRYYLYRSETKGVKGKLLANISSSFSNYEDTNLCNKVYFYTLEAQNSNLISKSNQVGLEPNYILPSEFTHIKNVTVKDQSVILNIKENYSPKFDKFILLKTNTLTGDISQIETKQSNLEFKNINTNSEKYIFTAYEIDKCNNRNKIGFQGNNIVLKTYSKDYKSILNWSPYYNFESGLHSYLIQLKDKNGIYQNVGTSTDTQFVHSQLSINTDILLCYKVIAISVNQNDSSISNISCTNSKSNIIMANAFSPNGDGVNDKIGPKSIFILNSNTTNFEGQKFVFEIFNTYGQLLFKTDQINEEWDGIFNGAVVQTGQYIYRLKAFGVDQKSYSYNGTILVIK